MKNSADYTCLVNKMVWKKNKIDPRRYVEEEKKKK